MKLIENMVILDVDNTEKQGMLINTLNGNISVVTEKEKDIIIRWQTEEVNPMGKEEEILYAAMFENGYLVTDDSEEARIVENILSDCRRRHERRVGMHENVVFVLTYQCNFACPYCYENTKTYNAGRIMNKEMVDTIYEIHNNSISRIAFYGGEPFLPETMDIIKYIISKSPNALFSATTNGYYLTEFIDVLKCIKVENIMVTLDGSEEIHNRTRVLKDGSGTYERISQGIKKCLNNSIPIKIRMNISEKNINECMALRESYIERFKAEYERGVLMFELQPIFQLSDKLKNELEEKIYYRGSESKGSPFRYNMMIHSVSPILKAFAHNSKKAFVPRYCNCDAEGIRVFYDAEGNIYSCILSLRNTAAKVGVYFPEYRMKEESILTRSIDTVKECSTCKLKFLCGGGCAYEIMETSGNVMNPNCRAIHNEIYNKLPTLYKEKYQ